jgi:hypothetical protein
MIKLADSEPPSRAEATEILRDTARAVRVMKASWLRVAINLREIRRHDLWRQHEPRCESYDEYVYGVLRLNKYVARRMLQAMEYTEERRPEFLERVRGTEESADLEVPSYDVVHQLRRARSAFDDREEEFEDLERRVFDDGVGRVVLKREIEEKLSGADEPAPSAAADLAGEAAPDTLAAVIGDLMGIEERLLALGVAKETRKLAFALIEALQKEQRGGPPAENRRGGDSDGDGAPPGEE